MYRLNCRYVRFPNVTAAPGYTFRLQTDIVPCRLILRLRFWRRFQKRRNEKYCGRPTLFSVYTPTDQQTGFTGTLWNGWLFSSFAVVLERTYQRRCIWTQTLFALHASDLFVRRSRSCCFIVVCQCTFRIIALIELPSDRNSNGVGQPIQTRIQEGGSGPFPQFLHAEKLYFKNDNRYIVLHKLQTPVSCVFAYIYM